MAVIQAVIAGGDPKEQALNGLLDAVLERHLQPEDQYEIAALLESMGWNDARAAEAFGVEDIFELAESLWNRIQQKVLFTPFSKVRNYSLARLTVELIRNFLRGVIFALPMAVSVFSMLTLRFSLWSYEKLSVELATSIAIGTILSFITVGGFTQAIARRGFFYVIQGYYNMARRVTFHFIALGFFVCIALCALIFLANLIIQVFPVDMLGIVILYFFFLNAIWLSVTVMYILKKEIVFTGLIIAGIGIVYALVSIFGYESIIVSQLISLMLVSVASIALVIYFFKKAEQKAEKGIAPKLPKMSVTLYSTLPYFLYGILYFSFLFVDRVMAWSTNSQVMPYLIWFRGDYELGLDFALLILIIPMGISEVVLSKLMIDIETSQKAYWGYEVNKMNNHYVRAYLQRLAMVAATAIVSALLIYFLTQVVFNGSTSSIGAVLFNNAKTHFVYIWSLIGYVFVAIALMNAVVLFSLSQPKLVIDAIWPALVTNLIVGFLLTRRIDYSYAIFGLVTGAIVFMVLSGKSVIRVLRKLDYYLYSAL